MAQDFKYENISRVRKIQGEITWDYIILNRNNKDKEKQDEKSDKIINSSRSLQLLHYSS